MIEYTKKEWLDYLWNRFGDFQTQNNFKGRDGDICFSKRKFWSEIRDNDKEVSRITHRTVFDCEVILDHDEPRTQGNFLTKLRNSKYKYILYTTGKNFHAHLIFPELRYLNRVDRNHFKYKLIKEFECDVQFAGNNINIACEYSKHWKRGTQKVPVYSVEGINSIY